MDKIQQLADYIDQSHSMVAITGAGISLAGGGVTYSQLSRKIRPGGFEDDSFLRSYVKTMHNYKPSFSHYALCDLEKAGKLTGIITTNEDCMHTMAGSKNVAEIQGSFQINRCSKCGRHYDGYEIWDQEDLPKCESCGGRMPDVVKSNKASHNPETARKLWEVSEELTGLHYPVKQD